MTDWIVKLYRKMNTTARRAAVLLLAFVIAMSTLHFMTFPATALTRKAGENDPGIVIGDETNTEGFDNASEGDNTEVNPVNTETAPAEEETITVIPEGETPAPADTTVDAEPTPEPTEPTTVTENAEPTATPDVNEEAAVIVEPTATPEVTPTPEPTETPAAEEVEEEPEEESDPSADVETAADWENLFRDVELTGVWADDLLTVAELQKGYKESEKNFVKDDEGKKYGYTRYGEWYGDPYAEWDSLFVMFNLYYAGITKLDFPYQADCEAWIDALKEAEMFHEVNTYVPNKGDLVFADVDEDGESDHVAIVKAVEKDEAGNPDKLIVIEGDIDNEVKESTYEFYNPLITGFAQLPENPEMVKETEAVEEAIAEEPEAEPVYATFEGKANNVVVTVQYEEGAFPEGTTMKVKPVWNPSVLGAINDTVTDKEVVKVQAVDIQFLKDGKEIEPSRPIKVTMKSTSIPKQAEETPTVVHVDDKLDTSVVEAEQAEEAEKPTEAVTFESDAFSVYAIVYTVDFAYSLDGRVFAFSMEGGTSMKLSALVEALGIIEETSLENGKAFVAEVNNVEFTDSTLLKVKKDFFSNDWTLTSLAPFTSQETLTITMNNGNVFTIDVTDEQETTSPWNLANIDNTQWLHVSVASSVTETEQARDAAFKLHFTYSLEENVVKAIDSYKGNPVLIYDLSDLIATSPIDIHDSEMDISIGNRKLGTCTFRDGVAYLEFTDPTYFDGRTSFTGFFDLTAKTDETKLGNNDKWTYEFPGTGDTVPVKYKKTVEEGSKSIYDTKDADGNYTLHYTANINVNTDLDSMKFNDVLSGLQTLDESSIKINGNSVSVTRTSDGFTFDVASALGTTGVAKGSYQVTYDTKVTVAQLEAMAADKTTETNKADWRVNGDKTVPGGETTYEIDKPVPPIPVEKSSNSSGTNQPGDIVTYTVTYGDENTVLAGFHISDSITDVVIPQGDNVTLNYGNGQSVQVPFGSQAIDSNYSKGNVTLFDYTFSDETTGNGPITVTYSVKIIDAATAKDNGVYDTTQVNNIAVEHRQNTNDSERTTVTYEKEPTYTVDKTASANPTDGDGNWLPGSVITYTLTIGDSDTNMAGVLIRDVMTDLQTLDGDIKIRVGNGNQMNLNDYVPGAITWNDDGSYGTNDVELFHFNMPSDAGNGPVVITYKTKVISQDQASASGIYGDVNIRNTGHGGKQSDGTTGVGPFEPYPINKTVSQNDTDVNGGKVSMGSTVHYTMTFGDASMDMRNVTISDEMTDLQKLVGDVTVTKADGTSFVMPVGSGEWATDGVVWNYFDDEKYSTGNVRVFYYKLPEDIGKGPIKVEYDALIISEEEANENGIKDTQHLNNKFFIGNHQAQTTVDVDFPVDPKRDSQVSKEFNNKWDLDTNTLYWDIIVEKTSDSAYPLENVTVREFWDENHIVIVNEKIGVYHHVVNSAKDFDLINAVVTTDDGTVLTPGADYTIDKQRGAFTFPELKERVHISLPFHSPVQISNGFTMHNEVSLNNNKRAEADAKYTNNNIEIVKNGAYTESSRIIKWEVQLNPSSLEFEDNDPLRIMFTDSIPAGLTLLNYATATPENPTLQVSFPGRGYDHTVPATVNENNIIVPVDIAGHNAWGNQEIGLNGNKIVISYLTKISDEEWNRITSSGAGSETFENTVTITAGDGENFTAKDSVTVTSDEYLTKRDTTTQSGGIVVNEKGNPSKKITYKIDINPHGYVLNYGNTLTLTDYISTNMDLDTTSVKLYTADGMDDKGLIPDTEQPTENHISYNDDSRLLALRDIPDGTPMVLEYTCVARAQGTDTFKNTATLIGGGSHSSSTSEEHNVQTNDAGVHVDGITISLHKIDENNIAKNLENAKFQLYECKLQIGDLTNTDNYDEQWWENLLKLVNDRAKGDVTAEQIAEMNAQFKIVEYVPVGKPVTTGATGNTQWASLNEKRLYAWKEVKAPDNYTGSEDYHYFVGYQYIDAESTELPQPLLPDAEQTKRKHAAWALDDAAQFANGIRVASIANLTTWTATNIHTPYTSITATKVWQGDSDNLFETRPEEGIRIQLIRIHPDGTRENYGSPVAINVDTETRQWPSYIWNRLELFDENNPEDNNTPYKYTVVEERVDGYTTTYSDNGEGQISGTITVTNKMIPKSTNIYVHKEFEGIGEDETLPSQILVHLMKIRTDRDGKAAEPIEVREGMLTPSNEWSYAFEKLDTKEVVNGVGYDLTYTVVEDTAELEKEGFSFTVSYSDNSEGVVETTKEEPLVITNRKRVGSVKVTKSFAGIESTEYPSQFKITSSWGEGENAKSIELTTSGEQAENVSRIGSGSSDDPFEWTISNIPIGTEVTFTESGYDVDGYEVSISGSATTEDKTTAMAIADEKPGEASFVNTYTPLTLDVTKIWKDTSDQNADWVKDIELELHKKSKAGTEEVFTYTVKQGSATSTDAGAPNASVSGNKDDGYTIHYTNLQSGYEYYVTEKPVDGYRNPEYKDKDGHNKPADKEYAGDKEYITNRPEDAYALPKTGGSGTGMITILGSILILLGAGVLLLRRRRESL